ncbi:recombinase family protein [Lentzea sp. NPDC059081]|uniref:recombinase family protein n=1 Tax=Lentzea sp. NPDC059081 TaxID=3346719 RepID=UPI0036C907A5
MSVSAPLRAGSYARQSVGNAASVADQQRASEAVCTGHGWQEVSRYSDLVSASRFGKKSRDNWAQLVTDVRAGHLDVVIMWDSSRGDRTVKTWAAFVDLCRDQGVLIHAVQHRRTYDPRVARDWKSLLDDGVDAAHDSERKSEDVRRGTAGAALAGKSHGPTAYGYTRMYDAHNRKIFRDVPDERAVIVQEIIGRAAREEPLKHIVDDLNARGVPSPKGGKWTARVVKTLATHPRYIALRSHKGELHPATWEPLVDQDLYRRAVAVLTAPDRRLAPPAAKKYLLSYISAAPCGGPLNAEPASEHRPSRYRCVHDGCTSVRADDLDEVITTMTQKRLARPDARTLFMPPDEETAAAQADITRLQARLEEARQSFAQADGISATALAGLERALQPQLDAALKRLDDLATCAAGLALLDGGAFTSGVSAPRWEALPLAGRRSVIKTLFETIEVGPSARRLSRWASKEERLLAVIERTTVGWRR